jgi:hypothetical protein
MRARGAIPPLAAAGSHDSVMGRAGARPVHLRSPRGLPGEDGGHVLSANTVQVQVHLLGAFDPGPAAVGAAERPAPPAGRAQGPADRNRRGPRSVVDGLPPHEHTRQADAADTDDNSRHD